MPNSLTVTAKSGAGSQITSLVLGDVLDIKFDFIAKVVYISNKIPNSEIKRLEFDLVGVTTVTFTISGSTYTMVIS